MSHNRWAAVDIETTGLDPREHVVIEVGICREDGTSTAFSLPFDVEKANPKALAINGWGEREFAPLMHGDLAAAILHSEFSDGKQLVASPAHFDVTFLDKFLRSMGYTAMPWSHRAIIDLKSYAQGVFGELDPIKNSAISERLGVENTSDHTAEGDAIWTARMFRELLKRRRALTEGIS